MKLTNSPQHKPDAASERKANAKDHLDEVQLSSTAAAKALAHTAKAGTLQAFEVSNEALKRFENPASSTHSGGGANALFGLSKTQSDFDKLGIDRMDFHERLGKLAITEFTPVAQTEFIAYMKARKPKPKTLAFMAAKVRQSLPPGDNKVGALRRYFNDQGIRLFGGDKLECTAGSLSLDHKSFRAKLQALESGDGNGDGSKDSASPGVIDKRSARELMMDVRELVDSKDIFYAHWQIKRRIYDGSLKFENRVDGEKLLGLLEEKGGDVNRKEISYLIRESRSEDFSEASVLKLKTLLKGSKDSDTLFYAQQFFEREMHEAQNHHRKGGEKMPGHYSTASASIRSLLQPKLEGQLDRRTIRRDVIKRFKAGEISRSETAGLMSAVAVSRTKEEFTYACMSIHAHMILAEGWQEILEAWDTMMRRFAESMSGDTYDSQGNLIETAGERHERASWARKQVKELLELGGKKELLAKQAYLRSSRAHNDDESARAHDPGQLDSLRGQDASLRAGAVDAAARERPIQ